MKSDFLPLVGLAKRAGKVAFGEDAVLSDLQSRKARLVIFACDAAQNTVNKISNAAAGTHAVTLVSLASKEELGGALGNAACAVCALRDVGFAHKCAALLAEDGCAGAADAADMLGAKKAKADARRGTNKKHVKNGNAKRA